MRFLACDKCDGAGRIHCGDADDECRRCGGSGNGRCDRRGCAEEAIGYDENGRALCEDCLMEWQAEAFDEDTGE